MRGQSALPDEVAIGNPDDRRQHVRWAFKGTAFPARIGKKSFGIRLKDLSRDGACAMTEEPLAVGDFVVVEFDAHHKVEARVSWVRNVMAGLEFGNLLNTRYVIDLHERAEEERQAQAEEDYLLPVHPPKRPTRMRRSAPADITLADRGARQL